MMDTTIILTCSTTLGVIIDRHFTERPVFKKLHPHDPRGSYGK